MCAQSEVLLGRRQQLIERCAKLKLDCDQLSGYCGLEIPLGQDDQYSFLHFVAGTLPQHNLAKLEGELPANVALLPFAGSAGRQPLLAMTTRSGRTALERALQHSGFQAETLPAVEGATADSLFADGERERGQLMSALEEADTEIRKLADQFRRPLDEIEGFARIEVCLLEAEQRLPRTEASILLNGWVPEANAPALEASIRRTTGNRCAVEFKAPGRLEDEKPPVLLLHPRWLRPFQMLVSAYGLPDYHELEPTLFVAVSYVLMFGMMFGDVGHGSVLAAVGLLALLKGQTAKWRDAGLLLIFAAMSSIAFGFAYGSFFGIERFKKYSLWQDPLEGDPLALMSGAIFIGIVMISLGLILNVINRFRRGDVIGGLLDKFGLVGALFYWGTLILIAKYTAIQSRGLLGAAILLFLVLPLLGWALRGPIEYLLHHHRAQTARRGENLLSAITESLVGAFEAVLSYLANTISFVRLAAYALSHAALLVATFMMSEEVKHLSVGGGILGVIVIILGNVVAIGLEGIIASVQALRLEYYEFFGKFFSGEGQPFEPFRLTPAPT